MKPGKSGLIRQKHSSIMSAGRVARHVLFVTFLINDAALPTEQYLLTAKNCNQ
jgi:hypothetical protein